MGMSVEVRSEIKQGEVDKLVDNMTRVVKGGGSQAQEIILGASCLGFRIAVQYPGISKTEIQARYHGSESTPDMAISQFKEEVQKAIENGGEPYRIARNVMDSLNFYPGMPGSKSRRT